MRKTKLCTGLMVAFGGVLMSTGQGAFAQAEQLERVEITGSAIKRIDAETAQPVTILKLDDLRKEGVTNVEQIIARISSSQSQQTTSQSVGLGTGGATFADLRGIGQNKTLVLLNGRRIANNSIDGSAPDLNTIPFAAIDRIEVLRDGASALYGTDAIGGVINFITRRSYNGITLTAGFDSPQHAGGKAKNASVVGGLGDLDKDRFNILASLDYQKQNRISASQRPFAATGFIPDRGLFSSSGSTDPANYRQGAGPTANPAGPACNANPYIFHQSGAGCREDFAKFVDLIPETERISGLINGTLKFGDGQQLTVSYFGAHDKNGTLVAPVPFAALTMNPGTPFFPGNGITPAPTNFTINPALPIQLRWRDRPNGPRAQQDINVQQRFATALEGNFAGWDYNTGIAYNQNRVYSDLVGGYADGTIITPGVRTGVINPFGDQTAAGQALLDSALAIGNLTFGKSETWTVDARASRELADWFGAGRPAAIAVGAEYRREKLAFAANTAFAEKVVASTGTDPATNQQGSRHVEAIYTELNIPLLKELEVTAAVRYDKYSDFGNTTNPKVSFRYQPLQQLLLRGAYSTGFRAPSLYELNNPQTYNNSANSFNDPVRCPGGVPIAGVSGADNCNTQFITLNGGNKNLNPEKARNFTLGLVFEPLTDVSAGLDFWWVKVKHQISVLPDTLIFADPVRYAGLFNRAADGSLAIDGSQCPGVACGYVSQLTSNLGEINTNGFDLNAAYRLRTTDYGNLRFTFNGTYVIKNEYQQEENGAFLQNAGIYSGTGPIFRWQHNLSVDWTRGAWGAGVVNHFKTGYGDQNDENRVSDPAFYDRVGSYTTWDIYGSWSPIKSLNVLLGIRNVLDRDPPFSNQGKTFQNGYDPRYTDPTGRSYYVRGTYTF